MITESWDGLFIHHAIRIEYALGKPFSPGSAAALMLVMRLRRTILVLVLEWQGH